MKEGWFKSIIIFIPVFLWCSPLQERIYNYSSPPNNNFQGSLIQSGILINSNIEFTSYALYTQYWVSPNLALAGSIAPYIAKNDLYHYQYIGANFQSIDDENKFLPISINTGIHRIINKKDSGNDRWFHFGICYDKALFGENFSFLWKNYFTKTESLKTIGIQYFKQLFNKLNFIYGIHYQINNSNLSVKLNIEFPI